MSVTVLSAAQARALARPAAPPEATARETTLVTDQLCSFCPDRIPAGSPAWKWPREQRVAHVDCARDVYGMSRVVHER